MHKNLIHIAMPKSGSSWVSAILEKILKDIGWRTVYLVPEYGRREQEIDLSKLSNDMNKIFCLHQQIRYSSFTEKILDKFKILPIIQFRNIFDTIISLYDETIISVINPLTFINKNDYDNLEKKQKLDYLIDITVPWYINYYVSWYFMNKKLNGLTITYEEMKEDPFKLMKKIFDHISISINDDIIDDTIKYSETVNTRKNKAIIGRGKQELTKEQIDRIFKLSKYHKSVNFSLIGL